jgi:hypothetical protein
MQRLHVVLLLLLLAGLSPSSAATGFAWPVGTHESVAARIRAVVGSATAAAVVSASRVVQAAAWHDATDAAPAPTSYEPLASR